MTHVIHRNLRTEVPTAVAGDGPYIIDREGKRYLDASGGAAVSCLGHSDREVTAAISAQLERIPYAHTGFFSTEPAEELAAFLASKAPANLGNCYFVSGGSEAIELALKIARQYFVERGESERHHIIARRQSYHGNTLAALAAGGNMWRRQQYLPLLIETHHISPCYEYRGRRADESVEEYGARVADELEQKIEELGPSSVMAFIAEPVVGATLGAVPSVPGYFKRIREICDRHGVLLILDEVMCGMGRCGTRFAFEQEGIVPDIVCVAKGLGAGYQPIGAMLVADRIVDAIREGTGFFQHGYTYIGHATACAGALAVQKVIEKRGLLKRVSPLGAELKSRLEALLRQPPLRRRHSRARPLHRHRARRGPHDEGAFRSRARRQRQDQGGRHGARAHVLPDGRHDRRQARRSHRDRAALHHRGTPYRRDRREAFDGLRSRLAGRPA